MIGTFERALDVKSKRNWEKIFIAVDLHETIIRPSYDINEMAVQFYPFALESLQLLTKRDDVVLILWTSSNRESILRYHKMFQVFNVRFDFVNRNDDVPSTELADFSEKMYMNVIIDDKAGFEAETDWKDFYWYLAEGEYPKQTIEVTDDLFKITLNHKPNLKIDEDEFE